MCVLKGADEYIGVTENKDFQYDGEEIVRGG